MIPWLDSDPESGFPDQATALDEPNGLLAAGGDLSVDRLVDAYSKGIFPWFSTGDPILWWSPDPRLIIRPETVHVSRRLNRKLASERFRITINSAFAEVIEACSQPRNNQPGTWILPVMKTAYMQLHQAGYAHSLEVWQEDKLAGGIYGVAVGRAFFGESMFHHVTDASKIALISLCRLLHERDFGLLDCQVDSAHLRSMGAYTISRQAFCAELKSLTTADQHRLTP